MPRPPRTIKGDTKVQTIAKGQEKIAQMAQDKRSPRTASRIIPIDSVVKPLT